MGLLQKIKSALGFDGTRSSTSSGADGHTDVDVTVEREPSTESEDAVKGTETSATGTEPGDADASEAAADLDVPDEEPTDEQVDETDEVPVEEAEDEVEADEETPAEAEDEVEAEETPAEAEDEVEADVEDEAEADTDDEAEADAEAEDDAEAAESAVDFDGADDPVTEIKGIGPAYAERLSGLGIETVGDLSVADAADIAAETDLAESRVAGWIESANDY